jgi:hypothetical protein
MDYEGWGGGGWIDMAKNEKEKTITNTNRGELDPTLMAEWMGGPYRINNV